MIVGTKFKYAETKVGNQDLELWLAQMTNPKLDFHFDEFAMEDGTPVTVLKIPAAMKEPTTEVNTIKAQLADAVKACKYWQDLNKRIEDLLDSGVHLGEEANQYIEWQPQDTSVFKMKISCESMGMKREVTCKCYVKDKKVRYIEWQEN